jgi:L-lactate dehydrogenase complex protein LldF
MKIRTDQFKELSLKALSNPRLMESLSEMGNRFTLGRALAFSQIPDSEALRLKGNSIKKSTLERLDCYLERLESKVNELGGEVHWARDARDAVKIVCEIAGKNGVRSVVKGKSMTSEEIGLNEALIEQGIDAVETDLGEFIIQLADEPPSHIVGPALHKSKEEVADLFAEKLGVEKVETPEELTVIARSALRKKFLEADMGITGANFAVAETGTIVLFENEGNIRFATTLPRIHVAIMGIEKVIPTLEDLMVLMKLLARSATGQKLSSYVSMITGPRRTGEWDGAEEFHLVILDNGRSRILRDEELRETLYCIRCGACLNICPVYQKIGGHSYGWVYSGPIGSILTPQLIDPERAGHLPFLSTLCGACAEAEDPLWRTKPHRLERTIMDLVGFFLGSPSAYRIGSRIARILQIPFKKGERLRTLPSPFREWSTDRSPYPFARRRFLETYSIDD